MKRSLINKIAHSCDDVSMAPIVGVPVSPEERARLTALPGRPQSPARACSERAKIGPGRLPVLKVARRVKDSRPAVWRWQLRFAEQGIDGLLRDKARRSPRRSRISRPVHEAALNRLDGVCEVCFRRVRSNP